MSPFYNRIKISIKMQFTDDRKPPESNEWEKKEILNNCSEKRSWNLLSVPQTKNQSFYFDKQSSFVPKKYLLTRKHVTKESLLK